MDADGISYSSYPGSDLRMFRCEPYAATLSMSSCASRWIDAQSAKGYAAERLVRCRGCHVGASHADQPIVHYGSYYERDLCPRCRDGAPRMIGGARCVSCYNRERELRIGKNAKGTAPSKVKPLDRRRARIAIHGVGAAAPVLDVIMNATVDRLELVIATLRRTKGRVLFGFKAVSPFRRQLALF